MPTPGLKPTHALLLIFDQLTQRNLEQGYHTVSPDCVGGKFRSAVQNDFAQDGAYIIPQPEGISILHQEGSNTPVDAVGAITLGGVFLGQISSGSTR